LERYRADTGEIVRTVGGASTRATMEHLAEIAASRGVRQAGEPRVSRTRTYRVQATRADSGST
jgi:hypothetical protein